jgi:galactose-1-phosphate uridylyltransferase
LPLPQFQALLAADVEVARRAYSNPAVRSVLVRKNQGRGSGASQPHVHNQVIGADQVFPAMAAERALLAREPELWQEIVAFAREHGFIVREVDGCCAYFCPFGTFPRSYEIVCVQDWVRMVDLPETRWKTFAALLHEVIGLLGPMPLDYEIHEGPGMPLHAHVNARHFAYSNIGGTLNLPAHLAGGPLSGSGGGST